MDRDLCDKENIEVINPVYEDLQRLEAESQVGAKQVVFPENLLPSPDYKLVTVDCSLPRIVVTTENPEPQQIDFKVGVCVRDYNARTEVTGKVWETTNHVRSSEYCEMWGIKEYFKAVEEQKLQLIPKLVISCDNQTTIDILNTEARGEPFLRELGKEIYQLAGELGYFATGSKISSHIQRTKQYC